MDREARLRFKYDRELLRNTKKVEIPPGTVELVIPKMKVPPTPPEEEVEED